MLSLSFSHKLSTNFYWSNNTIDFTSPFLEKLEQPSEVKKILIKNEYGLLGNLLYRYRNELDEDILIELYLKDIENIEYTIKEYGHSEYINFQKLFKQNPKMKEKISNNKKMLLEFLKLDVNIYKFANKELKNDKDLAKIVLKQNGELFLSLNNC